VVSYAIYQDLVGRMPDGVSWILPTHHTLADQDALLLLQCSLCTNRSGLFFLLFVCSIVRCSIVEVLPVLLTIRFANALALK